MASKRQLQVASLIKRNISIVLQQEGSYIYGVKPLVTVTNVVVTPDLSEAKIYLSVFNIEDKQSVILELKENKMRVRQLFGARVRKQLRRVPNLIMFLDDTLDEMDRLNQLFNNIE